MFDVQKNVKRVSVKPKKKHREIFEIFHPAGPGRGHSWIDD